LNNEIFADKDEKLRVLRNPRWRTNLNNKKLRRMVEITQEEKDQEKKIRKEIEKLHAVLSRGRRRIIGK
jgi:hypothetical protein